ncbi:MAG: Bax inhibitor-1/YccA family protein [Puniceicoccales bacterium]|jgi:uncharacterized YccA/Bax inhibitor family protein|nr:Bax inhibitor-1/YccA family protein [Puniceicoccales bacterium]
MSYDTSNPILSSKNFARVASDSAATLQGTINRCLILLALVFGSAVFAWASPSDPLALSQKLTLFMVLGTATLIVTCVKKEWSAITAPLYAICEGLILGAVSKLFEIVYPGIVFQAVTLTFGIAFGVLVLYRTGVIRVTEKFKMVMFSALFGIFMLYLLSWVLSFLGVSVPFIHSAGIFGIAFTGFVAVIAALSLAVDFDFIVNVSDCGMPVHMSWFAAFGLVVGLIYLYVHILRLLAQLRSRN